MEGRLPCRPRAAERGGVAGRAGALDSAAVAGVCHPELAKDLSSLARRTGDASEYLSMTGGVGPSIGLRGHECGRRAAPASRHDAHWRNDMSRPRLPLLTVVGFALLVALS